MSTTTTTTTTTTDSQKARLFRLDDALDTSVADEGWRLPKLDGPEGYVNTATSWTDGRRCCLRGDIIHEGSLTVGGAGLLGNLLAEFAPAVAEAHPLLTFQGRTGIVWVSATLKPVDDTPAALRAHLYGGDFAASADGLAYLAVEVEYLLASAL